MALGPKIGAVVAAVASATLLLSSCGGGSGDEEVAADAADSSGETASGSGAEIPSVESGEPQLPVKFAGDDGVDVEVDNLDSVFVLDDATMEIMDALGLADNIGIAPEDTGVEDIAAHAEHRVTATGSRDMTVEGVVSMDPTLVIGTNMARHDEIIEKLQDAEVDSTLIDLAQSPPEKIRKTGELLGVPDAGAELGKQVEGQLDEAETVASGINEDERPRVMVLSSSGAGDSGATTAAGSGVSADTIITGAGGINTGAEAGLERYSSVTAEGLVSAAPEVIVVAESELETLGGAEGIWDEVSGLSSTPAAEDQRLIVMDDMQLKGGGVSAGVGTLNLQHALFGES